MHDTPTDLRAVLRDYARDMVLPALELYTEGLMTDSTMYDAFLAEAKKENPMPVDSTVRRSKSTG